MEELSDTLNDFIRIVRKLGLRPNDPLYNDLFVMIIKRIRNDYAFLPINHRNVEFCRSFDAVMGDEARYVYALDGGSDGDITLYEAIARHLIDSNPTGEIIGELLKRYVIITVNDGLKRYLDGLKVLGRLGDGTMDHAPDVSIRPLYVEHPFFSSHLERYLIHRLREFVDDGTVNEAFLYTIFRPYTLNVTYVLPLTGGALTALLERDFGRLRDFERESIVRVRERLGRCPLIVQGSDLRLRVERYVIDHDRFRRYFPDASPWSEIKLDADGEWVNVAGTSLDGTNSVWVYMGVRVEFNVLYDFVFKHPFRESVTSVTDGLN